MIVASVVGSLVAVGFVCQWSLVVGVAAVTFDVFSAVLRSSVSLLF